MVMNSTGGGAPSFERQRILVVEDRADCREMLCQLLRLCGHEVRAAADGIAAVRTALGWRPEAAVIDLGLHLLDGLQAARELRARFGDGVLLIALTAYGAEEDRRLTAEAGFDAHLVKPTDPGLLRGLVARSRQAGI